MPSEKGTKGAKAPKQRTKVAKQDQSRIVKKAFFLPAGQFRALKLYALTHDLGVSEALQIMLAKAGIK